MKPIYSDHNRLDERSLAMHQLIAQKVLADPALLDKARENVRRWQKTEGSPMLALSEWENILSGPAAEVAEFLVQRSEKATRLRQSSPFTGILTEPGAKEFMNRSQLEHIIRAASEISGDAEIVVIGSQAIHVQPIRLPPIAFQSMEADVYPRNHPERADEIDGAIGELSTFHDTYGYYAHGIGPETAILPAGWQQRLIRYSSPNTGGATALCSTFTTSCFRNTRRDGIRTENSIKPSSSTGASPAENSPGWCAACRLTTRGSA